MLACAPTVSPETMMLVVTHESSRNPYSININGSMRLERQPRSYAEAVLTAKHLAAAGYNFDSGLGQFNSVNVKRLGHSWEEVFEPCSNLRFTSRVLTECYERAQGAFSDQHRLAMALSCYNTGDYRRGFANGYVKRVYRLAGQVGIDQNMRFDVATRTK
jgi:type IV secretion system protein VirB1